MTVSVTSVRLFSLQYFTANVLPGESPSLLQRRDAGTVNQLFHLLSQNPLGKIAAGFVVHVLEFLDIQKFIVGKLGI